MTCTILGITHCAPIKSRLARCVLVFQNNYFEDETPTALENTTFTNGEIGTSFTKTKIYNTKQCLAREDLAKENKRRI